MLPAGSPQLRIWILGPLWDHDNANRYSSSDLAFIGTFTNAVVEDALCVSVHSKDARTRKEASNFLLLSQHPVWLVEHCDAYLAVLMWELKVM